jgi:L,D-transpeptidase ErfK/SrfK
MRRVGLMNSHFILCLLLLFSFFSLNTAQARKVSEKALQGPLTHSSLYYTGDKLGKVTKILSRNGDTLRKVALEFDVGYLSLLSANPKIHPKKRLTIGTSITLPTSFILPPKSFREGIVINIGELRLYYYSPDGIIYIYPVALGRAGWHTPLGKTRVVRKTELPDWHPPKSIREHYFLKYGKELPEVVKPGPKNPLGEYALYLGIRGYLIHGTNNPKSIGTLGTSGCIRLYNYDIETLFHEAALGTKVSLIYYPVKFGWDKGILYAEAHKTTPHIVEEYGAKEIAVIDLLKSELAGHSHVKLDLPKLRQTIKERTGLPVQIAVQLTK